jgi:hypothetical protein
MPSVFKQARAIVGDIEKYLENLDNVADIFELGIQEYFQGNRERFEERAQEVQKLETENDRLRGKIKTTLYTDLLIPDARGDVLGLIETLDGVLGVAEHVVDQLSIEKPVIYDFLKDDFIRLTEAAVKTVKELVVACRAFFRDPVKVKDSVAKIHFWEHEADKIEERIKRKAFDASEITEFSRKVHMRYFAERISLFADEAEDVAERLEVYAIKRAL